MKLKQRSLCCRASPSHSALAGGISGEPRHTALAGTLQVPARSCPTCALALPGIPARLASQTSRPGASQHVGACHAGTLNLGHPPTGLL